MNEATVGIPDSRGTRTLREVVADHATLRHLDCEALDRLIPALYEELRVVARAVRRQHHAADGPGTTSIVHEAYLKLHDGSRLDWIGRSQFLHLASLAMRSILIDNARARGRLKRGGDRQRVPLDDHLLVSSRLTEDLLTLDAALERLAERKPRWSDVVSCRVFGGMELSEIAEALEISLATVKRDWQAACLWLHDAMDEPLSL